MVDREIVLSSQRLDEARSGKLLVVCTPGFYRYDNVRLTCARYGIPVYGSLDEAIEALP